MNDPHNLQRFVDAQNPLCEQVYTELRDGRKRGHWIWFVFPQLQGLGSSAMAIAFGISSQQEAEAYLDHVVLGPRLRECTRLVNLIEGRAIGQIFGYPDDQGRVGEVLRWRARSAHARTAGLMASDSTHLSKPAHLHPMRVGLSPP
jgi:uncharacterized protein (DUF1810 family)